MKPIPEELRPKCSCGAKMIIVNYHGYYEQFNYFACAKCNVDADDYERDGSVSGDFA